MAAGTDNAPDSPDVQNAAFIAAALFALHPTHIESLQAAWGLKDLLMAGFGLSAIPPFLEWLRTRRWQSAAMASALLACAGMCKGVAVSLLAPLWLLAYWRQPPAVLAWRAAAATGRLLPVAVVPLLVFAVFVWASPLQNFHGEDVANFTDRPLIILGGQTLIALVPYPLSLLYAPYGPLSGLYLGIGAAALFCVAWTAWRFANAPGIRSFGVLFFAVMLLPYLQLAPFNTTSMIADRFNFTAVFGLCVAAGAALSRLPRRQAALLFLALVSGYLLVIVQRAPEWATPTALQGKDWRRTTPLDARARYVVIDRNMERVRQIAEPVARESRRMTLPEANEMIALLADTQKALSQPRLRTPDIAELAFYGQMESDVAGMYKGIYETHGLHPLLGADASTHALRIKRYRRAQQWAELAIRTPDIAPDRLAVAYKNLGIALAAQGNPAEAERALRQSLRLQPQANAAACALRDLLSSTLTLPAPVGMSVARFRTNAGTWLFLLMFGGPATGARYATSPI